jgi:DNA uptake protein ComE-like DNA-binding protein
MRVVLAFCLLALWWSGAESGALAQKNAPQTHLILAPEDRVDINHASLEQLSKIPGMTQTWAARIVRFRPYRTKVDLVDKGILTPEVYERVKDSIIAHREKAE